MLPRNSIRTKSAAQRPYSDGIFASCCHYKWFFSISFGWTQRWKYINTDTDTDTDIDIWDMHYLSLKCVENNAYLVVFDGQTYKQWPYLIRPMYATFLIWIAKSRYHLSVAFESNRVSLNFHESWIKSIDLNENTLKNCLDFWWLWKNMFWWYVLQYENKHRLWMIIFNNRF